MPLSGRPAFAYLLLEHQSTVHRHMPVRPWKYLGRIWDRYIEEHPKATRLPAIVSRVEAWGDRVLTAATLDEVLAEPTR